MRTVARMTTPTSAPTTPPAGRPARTTRRAERARQRSTSLLLPKDLSLLVPKEPRRVSPRLALYRRRSHETAASISLSRQDWSLVAKAKQLGGTFDPVTDVYEDDDLSAKGGTFRPAMEAMLRAVQAGQYDGVLVWEVSRWTRNPREGRIAGAILRDAGCDLYSHEEPWLSLFGPTAFFYDWVVEQAAKESDNISRRMRDFHAYANTAGHIRWTAPFGTRKAAVPSPFPDRTKPIQLLVPDEEPRDSLGGLSPAALMRDAARRIIGGESAASVAASWNEAGYPGPSPRSDAGPWRRNTLARSLRNPALAGYFTTGPDFEPVLSADGSPLRPHTAVLDDTTWQRLSAALATRASLPRSRSDSLLRHLARCGRCGGGMTRSGGRRQSYSCIARTDMGAAVCQGVYASVSHTDAFVVAAVLELLADPERLAATRAGGVARQQREERLEADVSRLRQQLERLERDKLEGEYDDTDGPRRYRSLKDAKTAELDKVLAEQSRAVAHLPEHAAPMLDATAASVAEAFDALSRPEQHTLVLHLVDRVVIAPATGRRFDVGRIDVVWRSTD